MTIIRLYCKKNIHKYGILLLFLISFNLETYSQYIKDNLSEDFISLTTEDGLSQNTVNTILKDKSGYVKCERSWKYFKADKGADITPRDMTAVAAFDKA